jgi:hypothetical protein
LERPGDEIIEKTNINSRTSQSLISDSVEGIDSMVAKVDEFD